jgi:hypothetical protein
LNFKTGDVVDMFTTVDLGANGLPSANVRSQILKINPVYTKDGRNYKVTAMTYEAAFEDGTEIVLDSPLSESNLYILAGAPSQPVTITFVLTSYSFGSTGFRAGSFPSGSKIILILINGFDGQASGGNGGRGSDIDYDAETNTFSFAPPIDGNIGGTVYNAQGVDTDIYFSGATPSVANPVADGYIRAPSGGSGGFDFTGTPPAATSGDGGDGGDGRQAGLGGDKGLNEGFITSPGTAGSNGEIDGSGSGWGNAGANNGAIGGAPGSGIIDSGATVVLFGDTPARYINGNGSHP